MALILLSPLTITLPILSSVNPNSSTTYSTSKEATITYSSAVMRTDYASTKGTALVQVPLNLPPQGIGFLAVNGKCSQDILPVTVTNGTTLNLELTSTNPANLYLLPTYTFHTSANGCDLLDSSILAVTNFTDYALHWTAPEAGTLYLLLTGPTTVVILKDNGSTYPVKEQNANITYAVSTETNFNDYSSTITTTYTTSSLNARPLYLQPPALSASETIGLVILILGIIGVAVFKERRL